MGGKVFDGVSPMTNKEVFRVRNLFELFLENFTLFVGTHWIPDKIYPIGKSSYMLKYKNDMTTNDLDFLVGVDDFIDIIGLSEDFEESIELFINIVSHDYGIEVKRMGAGLSMLFEGKYQVDLIFCKRNNAAQVAKFHTYRPDCSLKDLFIALSAQARKQNMLMSPFEGLYHRDAEGKKADFITDNGAEIIKQLYFTSPK